MSLRIAVASGKGGTGKTTIATNLAVVLAAAGERAAYVDCDVEEPNGHLFLRPAIESSQEVSIPVPEVDEARCTLCGACGKACRFSAILALPAKVLTFPKLCHGCGGCTLACEAGAIREVPRVTGVVEAGHAGELAFLHGTLNVGEAMAPPVIRAVLAAAPREGTVVIDAPPGTSCPVIESVKDADVVLLVTEPTPFGLNDLRLAVEMVRALGVPFAVAVNRAGCGDRRVQEYCTSEGIPVVLELANDARIARAYSRGELAGSALPELRPRFLDLHRALRGLAGGRRGHARQRPTTPAPASSSEGPLPSERLPAGEASPLSELVVVSGKGGTGKTSIVASFSALAGNAALADCDVDAADLHLVLGPTVRERRPFSGGRVAAIDPARCTGCGLCVEHCRFDAIRDAAGGGLEVDPISCEGCGVCVDLCPETAAALVRTQNGEWFVSETRHGPMVHARLGIAQENSGKLVSLVRREARAIVQLEARERLIVDGSPGIGCPVIASVTGASLVLVVTEPTLSGLHDLRRVAELCEKLRARAAVCINKADLNPDLAAEIEAEAERMGIARLGRVRYDDAVTAAQVQARSVVELGDSVAARDLRAIWERVRAELEPREAR
jgi:MinD superfamily P-loop ATPase